jgi:hypothetical protein
MAQAEPVPGDTAEIWRMPGYAYFAMSEHYREPSVEVIREWLFEKQ